MRLYTLSSSLLKNKSNNYSRPIIKLTIAGVALGIVIMIVAIAITSGYKNAIRDKIIGMGAHIKISHYDRNYSFDQIPIEKAKSFNSVLLQNAEINHLQYTATKSGILKTSDQVEGVILKGIDDSFLWSNFENYIIEGEKMGYDDSIVGKEIIISSKFAKKLKLKIGDKIAAYFVQDPPKQRNFTIAAIYETGLPEYDDKIALVDLRQIQKLNNWNENQIGNIEVFTTDYDKIDETCEYVHSHIGYDLKAETIKELYPNLFQWINLFDTNVIVLMIITICVCIITIISTFFIIVLEETKTIGILKTIGMGSKQVFRLFLLIATRLIIRGLFYGNLVAFSICLLQHYFHFIKLDAATYYIQYVPIAFPLIPILAINIGVMVICLLTLSIPALYISKRISPITAIRFD